MPDYITVAADNSLQRFGDSGSQNWSTTTSEFVEEVVVDSDAAVYVQEVNDLIEKYDNSGNFVWDIAADSEAIDVDDHQIYSVRGDDVVLRDKSDGSQVASVQNAHQITRDVVAGFNEDFYTVGEDSNANAEIKHWTKTEDLDWRITITDAIDSGYQVTVNEEYVYIGIDYRVYEIDKNTGNKTLFQEESSEAIVGLDVDDDRRITYKTDSYFGVHDFNGSQSWRKADFGTDTFSDISPRPSGESVVIDHDGNTGEMTAYLYDSSGTEIWTTSLGYATKTKLTGAAGFPSYAANRFYWNNAPYVEHTDISASGSAPSTSTIEYITGRADSNWMRFDAKANIVFAGSHDSSTDSRGATVDFDGNVYTAQANPEKISQDGTTESIALNGFVSIASNGDEVYCLSEDNFYQPYENQVVVYDVDTGDKKRTLPVEFDVSTSSDIEIGIRGDYYIANEQNLYHYTKAGQLDWKVEPSASSGEGTATTTGDGYVYYDTSSGIKKVDSDTGNIVTTFSERAIEMSGNAKGYVAFQTNIAGEIGVIDPAGNVTKKTDVKTSTAGNSGSSQTVAIRRNEVVAALGAPTTNGNYVPQIKIFDLDLNLLSESDPDTVQNEIGAFWSSSSDAWPLITAFPPYEAFSFNQDGTVAPNDTDIIGQPSTDSKTEKSPSATPTNAIAGVEGPSTSTEVEIFQSETNSQGSTDTTDEVVLVIDSFDTSATGDTSTDITIDTSPFTSSTPVDVSSTITTSKTGQISLTRSKATRVVSFTTNSSERREIVGASEPTTSITRVQDSSVTSQGVDTTSIPAFARAVDNQTATRLDDSVLVQTFGGSTTTSTSSGFNTDTQR